MSITPSGRELHGAALVRAFDTARAALLAAALDLGDAEWMVPYDPGIQPTAWDLLHVAWFAEFWLLRGPHRVAPDGNVAADGAAPRVGPDAQFDSARIAHRARWQLPLPPRAELLERLQQQLAACKAVVAARGDDPETIYFARLAVLHELMHVEALWWTRARLCYRPPPGAAMRTFEHRGELAVAGRELLLGRPPTPAFAFDNERPQRAVTVAPFRIDCAPVTNAQFLEFVVQDGYRRPEFWPGAAAAALARSGRTLPARWRRAADGSYQQRWFDAWIALPLDQPVVHVAADEAEAWCRFAGRRLPSAAEWECAADQFDWGRAVWEWTSSAFAPYPGFRPGPYTTYSAPWFHHQRELRGGAFATHALMHDRHYRNFFLPWRTDVFAGFRSASDA